jgi:hypothetical protein
MGLVGGPDCHFEYDHQLRPPSYGQVVAHRSQARQAWEALVLDRFENSTDLSRWCMIVEVGEDFVVSEVHSSEVAFAAASKRIWHPCLEEA